ncbi:hypothetical protein YC2023_027418 [Brassica napus]
MFTSFFKSLIALALPPLTQAFITSLGEERICKWEQDINAATYSLLLVLLVTEINPPEHMFWAIEQESMPHVRGVMVEPLRHMVQVLQAELQQAFHRSGTIGVSLEELTRWRFVSLLKKPHAPKTGLLLAPDCVLYLDISPEIAAEIGFTRDKIYEPVDFRKLQTSVKLYIIDAGETMEQVEKKNHTARRRSTYEWLRESEQQLVWVWAEVDEAEKHKPSDH